MAFFMAKLSCLVYGDGFEPIKVSRFLATRGRG